ncbi:MAG: glycogen debranching protein GlgX, partial [Geminicoccaceae bacterium]
ISPRGGEMMLEGWHDPLARCFGLMLNGKAGDYRTPDGRPADDDVLLIVMNAHHDMESFKLPRIAGGAGWRRCLDTTEPEMADDDTVHAVGDNFQVPARSLILFICYAA